MAARLFATAYGGVCRRISTLNASTFLIRRGSSASSSPIIPAKTPVASKKNSGTIAEIEHNSDDFMFLLKNSTRVVDKSEFIREFLDGEGKLDRKAIVTAPKRWGKTILLGMLKTFLQFDLATGKPYARGNDAPSGVQYSTLDLKASLNYEVFRNTYDDFSIARDDEFVNKWMGSRPVLLINLGGARSIKSLTKAVKFVGEAVGAALTERTYLLNAVSDSSSLINAATNSRLTRVLTGGDDLLDVLYSVSSSSSLIHKCTGLEPIILVDDYDHLLNEAMISADAAEFADIEAFYSDFMSHSFKLNSHLYKALLFGNYRIALDVDYMNIYDLLNTRAYGSSLGFSEKEFLDLCETYNISEVVRKEMKEWYNGFAFIDGDRILPVYNPHSVTWFLESQKKEQDDSAKLRLLKKLWPSWQNPFEHVYRKLFGTTAVVNRLLPLVKSNEGEPMLVHDVQFGRDDHTRLADYAAKASIAILQEEDLVVEASNALSNFLCAPSVAEAIDEALPKLADAFTRLFRNPTVSLDGIRPTERIPFRWWWSQ